MIPNAEVKPRITSPNARQTPHSMRPSVGGEFVAPRGVDPSCDSLLVMIAYFSMPKLPPMHLKPS